MAAQAAVMIGMEAYKTISDWRNQKLAIEASQGQNEVENNKKISAAI